MPRPRFPVRLHRLRIVPLGHEADVPVPHPRGCAGRVGGGGRVQARFPAARPLTLTQLLPHLLSWPRI